jgi:hypothetical protein
VHICCDPDGNSGGNTTQDYIKLNTGLVNNFNNFNNICNILHICMKLITTESAGSSAKVINFIIIYFLTPDTEKFRTLEP